MRPMINLLMWMKNHPIRLLLGALFGFLVGLSQITGLNLRDLARLQKPPAPVLLSEEERLALRVRVRDLAVDGAVSADEAQELREYAASLGLEAQPVDRYLSEIEPRMVQSAQHLQEGLDFAVQERFREARARFREATRLDAENTTAWASFGGAALELGATAEAEAALSKALALEPENIEANYNFGACLAAQNRGPAALDHLERSLSLQLRAEARPIFTRQALLDDLQTNGCFSSVRTSPRFAALIQKIHDDFR